MINNDFKMPVVLIGNSFKYEIEAILKLFFNTARFSFSNTPEDACGDSFVSAELSQQDNTVNLSVTVKLLDKAPVQKCTAADSEDDHEYILCHMLYHILCDITGVVPPWGMMTGIRP
ncbi:MAG: coproporphyrinogen dehydrogenase HemZ, partial [Ruminococcus sp.]|nr:coproporphyrinogen dehydrogenase HemZ [Ruminococcus sp.]